MTTDIYRLLQLGYERGLVNQSQSLYELYNVRLNNVQIKVISSLDANAHKHGRTLTTFERRIKAHSIYGYRG